MNVGYKWGYKVISEYRMKPGIDTNVLTSRSTFKNAQNGQKSHQNAFGDVTMQILHANLTQLLKVTPKKKGENVLEMGLEGYLRVYNESCH